MVLVAVEVAGQKEVSMNKIVCVLQLVYLISVEQVFSFDGLVELS